MINLLIDRIGNVNIFNILDSNNSPSSESHIHSKIDDDLISEFIKELENIYKVSRSILSKPSSSFKPDILKDLKSLGETFFDQFFPLEIAQRLRSTTEKFLHFHIDESLKDIPWEILYDGSAFLADKFYIGRSVKGGVKKNLTEDIKKIKMLIIADPTEDLEWAQKEGEKLFQVLKEKVNPNLLELDFISGRQITKLKLLSMIKGKHVIHYAGHLFFSKEPLENGWLLADNKVLKAREISNSGFSTNLVFSNSCQSSKSTDLVSSSIMNYFAGSFLMSGIKTFVGTNWEVVDNEKTLDFTIRFYLSIFNQKSIGEALFHAREYARRNYESWDLTWANYTLHGVPNYQLLTVKKENRYKILNPSTITKYYPTPIAKPYAQFISMNQEKTLTCELMNLLVHSFINFSNLVGSIVFSDHKNQAMGKIISNPIEEITLFKWWELIYISIWNFKRLEISMFMDSFMEVLALNREIIFKMIHWIEDFQTNKIEEEYLQGYLVTFQYYYENLLAELSEFENCLIFYFPDSGNHYFNFNGSEVKSHFLIGSKDLPNKQFFELTNKFFIFHKNKKFFLPLYGYKLSEIKDNQVEMMFLGFNLGLFES